MPTMVIESDDRIMTPQEFAANVQSLPWQGQDGIFLEAAALLMGKVLHQLGYRDGVDTFWARMSWIKEMGYVPPQEKKSDGSAT